MTIGLWLQVAHSPYSGFLHCLSHTVRTRGAKALFKSYPTTVRPPKSGYPEKNICAATSCLGSGFQIITILLERSLRVLHRPALVKRLMQSKAVPFATQSQRCTCTSDGPGYAVFAVQAACTLRLIIPASNAVSEQGNSLRVNCGKFEGCVLSTRDAGCSWS